jgi:hypothetical protein
VKCGGARSRLREELADNRQALCHSDSDDGDNSDFEVVRHGACSSEFVGLPLHCFENKPFAKLSTSDSGRRNMPHVGRQRQRLAIDRSRKKLDCVPNVTREGAMHARRRAAQPKRSGQYNGPSQSKRGRNAAVSSWASSFSIRVRARMALLSSVLAVSGAARFVLGDAYAIAAPASASAEPST